MTTRNTRKPSRPTVPTTVPGQELDQRPVLRAPVTTLDVLNDRITAVPPEDDTPEPVTSRQLSLAEQVATLLPRSSGTLNPHSPETATADRSS